MAYKSKYFSDKELMCPCGCGDSSMDEYFLKVLDLLRESYGAPLYLNSAKRCEKHNKEAGGKPNSAHLSGQAADIRVNGGTQRYAMLAKIFMMGIVRIGIGGSFIHIDVAENLPRPVIWTY